MAYAGQVALVQFPQADLTDGKLRPVLLLAPVPGHHGDWLVCMVSSRLHQLVLGFDDVVQAHDPDIADSGLKVASVLRIGRLAVVHSGLLVGALGHIGPERLTRVRDRLSVWLAG